MELGGWSQEGGARWGWTGCGRFTMPVLTVLSTNKMERTNLIDCESLTANKDQLQDICPVHFHTLRSYY